MNNKFACKGSKNEAVFCYISVKKGVLFAVKSDKIDRFYAQTRRQTFVHFLFD
ncbi:hypothetical protein [Pedobacter borealis]|uniref:hypothetical protein n=1 Tax=Pedobacter borealis TaxID=475254 RepID=UPI0012FC4547|nr:hypothetical protein [Pedobacter borealis]